MMALLRWWRNRKRCNRLVRYPNGRVLLRYWDGSRTRYADMFPIVRKLNSDPRVKLVEIAPRVDEGHEPETSTLVRLLCEVFQVRRYDDSSETGLTDAEILKLLESVAEYLNELRAIPVAGTETQEAA